MISEHPALAREDHRVELLYNAEPDTDFLSVSLTKGGADRGRVGRAIGVSSEQPLACGPATNPSCSECSTQTEPCRKGEPGCVAEG